MSPHPFARVQVVQTRTLAGYEKMVLTVNEWLVEQTYDAFADVIEVEVGRYMLQIITDDGVPKKREKKGNWAGTVSTSI